MTSAAAGRPTLLARASDFFTAPTEEGRSTFRASPIEDPRSVMPRAATVLAALAIPLVLATAGPHVGTGHSYAEVVAATLVFAASAVATALVPWRRLAHGALVAIVAAQIVFVATLDNLTGGGQSPYFVLYAPILALAGWFLRRTEVALVIAVIVATELWRALVLERSGSVDQLSIGMPFFALIAVFAMLTAERFAAAITVLREQQVQTAAALEAVRTIGSKPSADPLDQLVAATEHVFGAASSLVRLPDPRPTDVVSSRTVIDGSTARALVSGQTGAYGVLDVSRKRAFSAGEARLLALLVEVTGHALEAGRSPDVRRPA